jgi:hypothetical protein
VARGFDIVQFFDFGDQPWEREIADWIKAQTTTAHQTGYGRLAVSAG